MVVYATLYKVISQSCRLKLASFPAVNKVKKWYFIVVTPLQELFLYTFKYLSSAYNPSSL